MSLARLRASIRPDEVLVLQGTPLLGALLATGRPGLAVLPWLALFAAGSCCLVAHVFLLNDWAGIDADRRDPNRKHPAPAAQPVSRRTLGRLSVAALLLALLLLGPFGTPTLALGLAIAALSAVYSLPPWPAKGAPVFGSLVHLAGGVLHFHLGYLLFGAFGGRSLALSAFFAVTFAAGHLTQEVGDHDADLGNGIRTNAVAFGRTAAFVAGIALFAAADALLVGMAARGAVPRALAAGGAALRPAPRLVGADPARRPRVRADPGAAAALPRALRRHRPADAGRDPGRTVRWGTTLNRLRRPRAVICVLFRRPPPG